MSTNPLDVINEVRRRQGREASPDPTVIQGFGDADDPPPPPDFSNPYPPVAPAPETVEPPPAVAPVRREPVARTEPEAQLLVVDERASYMGKEATLNASEQARIARVVLSAVLRNLRDIQRTVRQKRERPAAERPEKGKRKR